MTAAAVTNVVHPMEITGIPCLEIITCSITTSGDWFDSQRFGSVAFAMATDSAGNAIGTTWATNRVTFATGGALTARVIIFGK